MIVLYWHFHQLPTSWLQFERGTFWPTVSGSENVGPFDCPPMGSYWLSIDTYGLSCTALKLFSWLQKHLRPSVWPGYDNKYRSRSYRFIEQKQRIEQKMKHLKNALSKMVLFSKYRLNGYSEIATWTRHAFDTLTRYVDEQRNLVMSIPVTL